MLWCCPRLHSLALIECVGPFSSAMLNAPEGQHCCCHRKPQGSLLVMEPISHGGEPRNSDILLDDPETRGYSPEQPTASSSPSAVPGTAGSSMPQNGDCHRCHCALRPGRWAMTELQLRGTGILLSDVDLSALIGHPPGPPLHTALSPDVNGNWLYVAPSQWKTGGLHTLALTGLPLVSDVFLWSLGRCQGSTLGHLCLERCGSAAMESKGPSSRVTSALSLRGHEETAGDNTTGMASFASRGVSQFGMGISEDGIRELLRACPALLNLRLRNCCKASQSQALVIF